MSSPSFSRTLIQLFLFVGLTNIKSFALNYFRTFEITFEKLGIFLGKNCSFLWRDSRRQWENGPQATTMKIILSTSLELAEKLCSRCTLSRASLGGNDSNTFQVSQHAIDSTSGYQTHNTHSLNVIKKLVADADNQRQPFSIFLIENSAGLPSISQSAAKEKVMSHPHASCFLFFFEATILAHRLLSLFICRRP